MRAGDFDMDHDHQVEAADTAAACEGPEGHCTVRGVVHPVHQTSRDVSTTADTTYYVIDTSESARTLTLSASTARPGRVIHVKRKGSHRVRIVAEGSAAVDGSSAITLTEDGESVTLVFNQETNTWEVF